MSKKSKTRALRQSDTRRAQLEARLRAMREDLRIADEGTVQLSLLCNATITHCLLHSGITDITVPEVNAAEIMNKYKLVVKREPEHKLHITISERVKENEKEENEKESTGAGSGEQDGGGDR